MDRAVVQQSETSPDFYHNLSLEQKSTKVQLVRPYAWIPRTLFATLKFDCWWASPQNLPNMMIKQMQLL